jgi:lipid II:glycine glycyltransferase (peptidoglycan interpeptide bridge formation enzyme)
VTFDNSWQSVETFYRLNSITRKHHGIPPQPKKFFKKIFEYIISARKGFVVLALQQGKPIAGAVYFLFGSEAIYKYGASDKEYQPLRPNNLVMWEAIKENRDRLFILDSENFIVYFESS